MGYYVDGFITRSIAIFIVFIYLFFIARRVKDSDLFESTNILKFVFFILFFVLLIQYLFIAVSTYIASAVFKVAI
ncbi:hypothetical protein ACFL0T_07085, partial [Candidatus Omnitrophota bacterium]